MPRKSERKFSFKVTAIGTSNLLNSDKYKDLTDGNCIELRPTVSVLKTLKSNFKNRARISKDLYYDAEASKELCQRLCLFSLPGNLVGYVQEISQNPFGLLFMAHIQVNEISYKFL